METETDTLRDHVATFHEGGDDNAIAVDALRALLLETFSRDDGAHAHETHAAVDADAVRALVAHLRVALQRDQGASPESVLLVTAIALSSYHNRATHSAAIEAGALSLLVALRGPPSATCADHVERVALAATLLLVRDHALAQAGAARAEMGVVASLVCALSSMTSSIVTLALLGLRVLVRANQIAQLTALQAAAVPALCRLLRMGFPSDRALAGRVLWTLLHNAAVVAALTPDDVHALATVTEPLEQYQQQPNGPEQDLDLAATLAVAVLRRVVVLPTPSDSHVPTARALVRELGDLESNSPSRTRPCASAAQQLLALEELSALLWSSDERTAQAAVDDGLVPVCLARLLSPEDHALRSCAAFVLMGVLVHHPQLRGAVRDAIALDALVEQIMTGNMAAVYVLGPLVDSSDDARAEAAAAGAVAALVGVVRDGRVQETFVAARALSRLVRVDDHARDEALNAGAMEQVLAFLPRTDRFGKLHALTTVECLARSCSGSAAAARDAFLRADGAPTLVAMLNESQGLERFAAGDVVLTLVTDHAVAQTAFVAAGVVAPLVQCLLEDESGSVTSMAVQVLSTLAERDASVKTALVAAETVLPRLVAFAATGAQDQKRYAADALGCIATGDAAAQTAVADAGGIDVLVQLLMATVPLVPDDEGFTAAGVRALGEVVYDHAVNQARAIRGHALLPLVVVLRRGGPSEAAARRTLAYLMGRTEPLATMATVDADVLQVLVRALQASQAAPALLAPMLAAHTIEQAVIGSPSHQSAALDAGVLTVLVARLQSPGSPLAEPTTTMTTTTTSVARALAFVVEKHQVAKTHALERHDAVHVLVDALRREQERGPHRPALWLALRCLLDDYTDAHRVFLATGALADLVHDLEDAACSIEMTVQAVGVVFMLAKGRDPRTIDALWDAALIMPVLAALPRLTDEIPRGHALFTATLVSTDEARRCLLAACFPLEAAMDVVPTATDALLLAVLSAVCTLVDHDAALRTRAIDRGVLTLAVAMVREPGEYGIADPCSCVALLVADDARAERIAVEELGTIELLGGLMSTLRTDDRSFVAVALASIRAAQRKALTSGVVAPLLALLQPSAAEPDDITGPAVRALGILVDHNPINQAACADAGALPLVLALVEREVNTTTVDSITRRRYAARALGQLVDGNAPVQRAAVEAGAVPLLRELLQTTVGDTDTETRGVVAAALAQLVELARSEDTEGSAPLSPLHTKTEELTIEDAVAVAVEASNGVGA